MRALVTGGTGFTGIHLVRRLVERGHEVTMFDLRRTSASEELEKRGARLVLGSVTDPAAVERAVAGHDTVYHLAAAFRQITAPKQFYWDVNVNGTRNVLAAAEKHSVRKVVHCSTSGVHGGKKHLPWGEDSPIQPSDYYQKTKWEGERVCQEFLQRGLDISIVRPTSEYGPGDTHGMAFLYKFVKKGFFLMFGNGRASVHPVYIDDLVDLFELVTEKPIARGRAYIAGDERAYTVDELVQEAGRSIGVDVKIIHLPLFGPLWLLSAAVEFAFKPLGKTPPLFRRRVEWYRKVRAYRIDRAKKELGFQPRVPLAEGLRRTAAWYREIGLV